MLLKSTTPPNHEHGLCSFDASYKQCGKAPNPLKTTYFLHAKELADSLAASGHLMSDPDLQQIILSGLDNAYDAIVTTLTATMADISMNDFYAHLIAFDMRLEAQTIMLQQHPVANVATQQRNMSFKPGFNQNRNRSYNGNQYHNRGQGPLQLRYTIMTHLVFHNLLPYLHLYMISPLFPYLHPYLIFLHLRPPH
ncbi:hypothetical protein GIB67_006820 [Kingdonia uniflora]|uniref:Uncharacterized protein n=1 Tax=Kingdonia uniflora TaxID=39325 RepID=A0A7J7L012_9MAGN|nr:hypothetical protein GIB67_006820 [Kingdonia uniflora]